MRIAALLGRPGHQEALKHPATLHRQAKVAETLNIDQKACHRQVSKAWHFGPAGRPYPGGPPGRVRPPGDGPLLTQEVAHVRVTVDIRPAAVHGHPACRRGRRQVRLPHQEYEEALAEARAAAWSAWHGLIRKCKGPLAVGVTGIANNAVRNVRQGRRVGNTNCGRGAIDVFRKARKARDYQVVSLDSNGPSLPGSPVGAWKEWLACDHRVGPADEACFRLDFAAWLGGVPETKRRVAAMLAEGHEGVVVARLVGIAPSRVSQLRHELEASWQESQGPASAQEAGDPHTAHV